MSESAKDKIFNASKIGLAGVFVFERWIWDEGKTCLQSLSRREDCANFAGMIRDGLAPLSPALTVAAFFAPLALAALFVDSMLGQVFHGLVLPGLVLMLVGQAVLIAIAAYIFDLTRERLMTVAWFAALAAAVAQSGAQAEAIFAPLWAPRRKAVSHFRAAAETGLDHWKPACLRLLEQLRAIIAPKTKAI